MEKLILKGEPEALPDLKLTWVLMFFAKDNLFEAHLFDNPRPGDLSICGKARLRGLSGAEGGSSEPPNKCGDCVAKEDGYERKTD